MTTISGFKAQMQGGGARPNQFRVEMTFPSAIGGLGVFAGQAAQFLCRTAALPQSTIEDIAAAYRGRIVHFAGERTFQPWTVSVYNDNNFLIRNAIESWHDWILTYDQTNGTLRPSDYQVDMSVYQLDRNDNILKAYYFRDVYPTVVGQIALDYETNNQIETFEVEFTYNYFTTSGI
jgi:hypothetical protein